MNEFFEAAIKGRSVLAALLLLHCFAVHAQARNPPAQGDAPSADEAATVQATMRPVTAIYQTYGQILPVAVAQVHAVEAGRVDVHVLPGEQVRAGQLLLAMGGAQAHSLLAERRGAWRAASVQLAADRSKLRAQLVTRQTVAADEAAYEAARARLDVALETLTVRATGSGQVLTVDVTNGEQVAAGQILLTLQTGRPWLRASFYGKDALAIQPGMTGEFRPASGGVVPVRVSTVSAALTADGGEQAGLMPILSRNPVNRESTSAWRSGMWGTVRVTGETRTMVAVPSRALILDRAQWWVLVRTPRGDQRRRVVPGPSRGWTTYIEQGLTAGEYVVVQNADLEYFRGIANQYTPPD